MFRLIPDFRKSYPISDLASITKSSGTILSIKDYCLNIVDVTLPLVEAVTFFCYMDLKLSPFTKYACFVYFHPDSCHIFRYRTDNCKWEMTQPQHGTL